MIEFYDYFLSVRYYFAGETLIFLALLVAAMLRFGTMVQGGEKALSWASPQPASRIFGASAGILWLLGIVMIFQSSKMLVIIGLCTVIAAIQLATHIDILMMASWYLVKTGKTVLGLGGPAPSRLGRHKVYLEKAKKRGKVRLQKAKSHGPLWKDTVLRW
jgi:hypothetical protein